MAQKVKLTITQVMPIRKGALRAGGEYEALDFTATPDKGESQQRYGIFNKKELFPFIVAEATIDAEVNDKESGNFTREGQPIMNHDVVNIYVNDKPVIQKQQKQGWQSQQDSPEKRRSIERQKAAELALALYPVGMIYQALITAEQIYQWISEGKFPPTSEPAKPTGQGKSTTQEDKTPPDAKPTPKETTLREAMECKTGVELFNFALGCGMSLEKIKKLTGVSNPKDIKDIPAAAKVLFGT